MRQSDSSSSSLPFTLASTGNQTQQMVDGIRAAITAGHWKPGDILPSAAQFQKLLGTGGYVPRTALRQLADEGLVILKQHVGAIVTPRKTTFSRGCIAFITSGHRESYYENVHAFCLQEIFGKAGWQLVHLPISDSNTDSSYSGFAALQHYMTTGLDFAICLTDSRKVAEELDKAGVRYIDEGSSGRIFPNAVATINLVTESEEGFKRLTSAWKAKRVRNVVIVDFKHEMPRNVLSAFLSADISFRRLIVKQSRDRNYLQGIQQSGLDAVAGFFSKEKNRVHPPDALFFYDDYLASGGLIALAATGLRVPEEIHVATFANKGLGPVWFKPLTRLEYDPVENAQLIGEYVLRLLAGENPTPPTLSLRFIEGET